MDIGRALSRAWEITWRWKILWVLGFLAALGQSTSGANSGYRFLQRDFQSGNVPNFNLPPAAGGLIAGIACLGLIVAIALWVISVMARGGLIAAVEQVEEEGSTTLGEAWAVGVRRFWTLFGIGVLTALPLIAIVIAMLVGILMVAGGAAIVNGRGNQAAGAILGGLFACICPSVCLLVVVGFALSLIRIYAERAAILDNLGWIDAFGRGWRVLRDNLGPTILLWLVFIVLGLIVAAIVLAVVAPFALPLAAFAGGSGSSSALNSALLLGICGIGMLGLIVGAIVGAVINTFTSATWTLAYRDMTSPRAPAVPPSEPFVEP